VSQGLDESERAASNELMARLDVPLMVITTSSDDQRAGCVIGFHTQCSIEPMRYAVWLSKANFTYRVSLFATHFALHLLDSADEELAVLFGSTSGDTTDKFAQCEWTPGPCGVPLLARCPNRIVLERTSLWDDGSDHVCCIGTPVHPKRGVLLPRCAFRGRATCRPVSLPTSATRRRPSPQRNSCRRRHRWRARRREGADEH